VCATSSQNLTLLRKIVVNLLGMDRAKGSLRGKRKRAAWDDEYMTRILAPYFMR
jgi:hypothetical protein